MVVIDGVDYYTSNEVCKLIGYSRSSLMDRVRDGRIASFNHNGRSLFNKEEIDRLKESNDFLLYGDCSSVKVSVKELASWLGKSPGTIYSWLREGKIRGSKVGRFVFFFEEDIKLILNQLKQQVKERPHSIQQQFSPSMQNSLNDEVLETSNKQ